MNPLIPYIWAAGVVYLVLLAGSFFLPEKLRYRENLSKVSPIIRQIFLVHHVFIALLLIGFSGLCFLFADELAGRSLLGRCLSGFMAAFWALRIVIQLGYYDSNAKRQYPLANMAYLIMFLFLAGVFSLAMLGR